MNFSKISFMVPYIILLCGYCGVLVSNFSAFTKSCFSVYVVALLLYEWFDPEKTYKKISPEMESWLRIILCYGVIILTVVTFGSVIYDSL